MTRLAFAIFALVISGGLLLFAPFVAMVGRDLARNASPMPRLNPVVRFNEHPFARRIFGKVLGVGASMRSAFLNLCRALSDSGLLVSGRAGMLNYYVEPLPVIPFQAAPVKENLPRAVYIKDLQCRLTGTLDVGQTTAGTTDGTLMTEPIARLISSMRVWWDGIDLIHPISGRDIAALGRRLTLQPLTGSAIASAATQAATAFELNFVVPFARAYNADPFETALPPLQVRRGFHIEVQWEQGLANAIAGTNAGSGAIITGGDRSVEISDVQLEVVARIARNGGTPWFLPQISVYETEQFSAANTRLGLSLEAVDPFDAVLLRVLDGGNLDPSNDLQYVTFKSKSTRIIDNVAFQTLRAIEEQTFGGVADANELGSLFIQLNDGGKLGNVVNPAELTLPEFEFNVEAPAVGPAVVRAIVMELLTVPGVTRGGK